MSWYFGICALALFVGATFLLVARARLSLFGARTTRRGGRLHDADARVRAGSARSHMPHVRFVGPDMREHTLRLAHGREPGALAGRHERAGRVPRSAIRREPRSRRSRRLWAAPAALYLFAAGLAYAAYTAA